MVGLIIGLDEGCLVGKALHQAPPLVRDNVLGLLLAQGDRKLLALAQRVLSTRCSSEAHTCQELLEVILLTLHELLLRRLHRGCCRLVARRTAVILLLHTAFLISFDFKTL